MPNSSQALYQAAKARANKLIERARGINPDEFSEMVRNEPDRGTHNVRNTFEGIFAPQWTGVRKTSEGMVTTDLFAFPTTDHYNPPVRWRTGSPW